ncbi:CRISPR system precrRNA processing endoribonuclease RAMP protein Cas6 [Chloroflexota bacterium]
MGTYSELGFTGQVKWKASNTYYALLRQVNALVNYAVYCGTGMKTTLGMGQSRRDLGK